MSLLEDLLEDCYYVCIQILFCQRPSKPFLETYTQCDDKVTLPLQFNAQGPETWRSLRINVFLPCAILKLVKI